MDVARAPVNRRFTLAPMMDWSDRHCRYLWRLISKHSVVYSEMVTTAALIQGGKHERHLGFSEVEHPIALQLGGSAPEDLGHCAKLAEDWGYDEVNLNCGCPSDRVQEGKIGAILMAEPELVADCIKAMQDACSIDVTIKHRIGIDDMEDYADMCRFVEAIAATGCKTFIVHARKAWLQGLSPKENREVPPLRYPLVHKLKQEYPELEIIINGGLKNLDDCEEQLREVDGVMVGREAYSNPYLLAEVDKRIYQDERPIPDRMTIYKQYLDYCGEQLLGGHKLNFMSRHVLGLFQGQPGARQFRRHISENIHKTGAGIEVMEDAAAFIR
ncbi:tRNA dihydrouridine(20/20a) synthase DusA [uncultured Pseudoteredinibacter sp.]|uniref:tRNA dihydrouridine(20/20a) synthase DusA n=1 Tax=uncultured Pseudoteredinibacter sp. TaxID=1641701 RepID=UPI002612795C|nr:tRNA dihydrouridine(20/20a) synthase DusA [uncultured Pseudoteredinibacter sp.]